MAGLDATLESEYWAARTGAAITDRSVLGRIEMAGADTLDLLHRLSTQDLKKLNAGQGAGAALTTEKGRIIDVLFVYHMGAKLLLITSPGNQPAVLAWIDRYTFTEDASAVDVTQATGLLALFGPRADLAAERLARQSVASLPLFHHLPVTIAGAPATLARAMEPGGGFHLLLADKAMLGAARLALLEMGADFGIQAIGPASYEILRIEAGLPAFGKEISERHNPLEAGLLPFISWTKGCYVGQEVIARLDAYDKVQRRLVGLILPEGDLPPPGARLLADGKEVGHITSATAAPGRPEPIGLGYVRTEFADPGAALSVECAQGPAPVRVAALPFTR